MLQVTPQFHKENVFKMKKWRRLHLLVSHDRYIKEGEGPWGRPLPGSLFSIIAEHVKAAGEGPISAIPNEKTKDLPVQDKVLLSWTYVSHKCRTWPSMKINFTFTESSWSFKGWTWTQGAISRVIRLYRESKCQDWMKSYTDMGALWTTWSPLVDEFVMILIKKQ